MEIQEKQIKGSILIIIKGSIDLYSSLDLKELIDEMNFEQPLKLIFDLKDVDYIDSSGIGTMIKVLNQIKNQDSSLALARLRPMIQRIFKAAGLIDFFEILTDKEFQDRT